MNLWDDRCTIDKSQGEDSERRTKHEQVKWVEGAAVGLLKAAVSTPCERGSKVWGRTAADVTTASVAPSTNK